MPMDRWRRYNNLDPQNHDILKFGADVVLNKKNAFYFTRIHISTYSNQKTIEYGSECLCI